MNPIRNPFSRDEYPALTDAITGVVNRQPRQVEEEITPKRMEVLNRAVKTGMGGAQRGFGTLANAQSRALADRASLAITRAHATKGGKKVTGFAKAKREHEAAKARHKTLKNTPAGFNRSGGVVGEAVTPAQRGVFARDAYPALTDATTGVVNRQPRQVEEDIQTPERRAETSRAAARAYTGQGRATTPRQRVAYGTGGKPDNPVREGVIRDTVQRVKNAARLDGFRTNRQIVKAHGRAVKQMYKKARAGGRKDWWNVARERHEEERSRYGD
jgi:hypothetical protein